MELSEEIDIVERWTSDIERAIKSGVVRGQKFELEVSSESLIGQGFYLVSNSNSIHLHEDFYNAIAPLYTFNPVTEKYEGKFTLLQIWEYLL